MSQMDDEVRQFNIEIQRFITDSAKDLSKFTKKVTYQLLKGVVEKNPVLTGYSRFNWQVTINTPTQQQIGDKKKLLDEIQSQIFNTTGISLGTHLADRNKLLNETLKNGNDIIKNAPTFCVIYIQNNVDYILLLEDGSSRRQAPHGMVGPTLREVLAQFSAPVP